MLPRVSAKWAYLQHMLLWYEMEPQAARSSNLCSLASRHNMLSGTQEVLPGFDKRRLHADKSDHISNPKSAVCVYRVYRHMGPVTGSEEIIIRNVKHDKTMNMDTVDSTSNGTQPACGCSPTQCISVLKQSAWPVDKMKADPLFRRSLARFHVPLWMSDTVACDHLSARGNPVSCVQVV